MTLVQFSVCLLMQIMLATQITVDLLADISCALEVALLAGVLNFRCLLHCLPPRQSTLVVEAGKEVL
jgi:hypothetical protein